MEEYNKEEIYNADWNAFVHGLKQIPTDETYKLGKEEATTAICQDYYANKNLWWVLIQYNEIPLTATLPMGSTVKMFNLIEFNKLWKSILKDNKIKESRSL